MIEMNIDLKLENVPTAKFVETLNSWLFDEGWFSTGPECMHIVYANQFSQFVSGYDTQGDLVGTIIYINDPTIPQYLYIAIFCVRADCRKQGIGKKIWFKMIEETKHLKKCLTLNSTPTQLTMYTKWSGLTFYDDYMRYFTKGWVVSLKRILQIRISDNLSSNLQIVTKYNADKWIPKLVEYDRLVVKRDRSTFWKSYIGNCILTVVHLSKDHETLDGFGVVFAASEGQMKIGPVFADSQQISKIILRRVVEELPENTTVGLSFRMPGGEHMKDLLDNLEGWSPEYFLLGTIYSTPEYLNDKMDTTKVHCLTGHVCAFEC